MKTRFSRVWGSAIAVCLVSLSISTRSEDATEHRLHEWEKVQLQSKFYCEGAGSGDFNHDGKPDIVSGPYWYEGPDFKRMHEFYPAKPFDKNGYSKNFFAFGGDVDRDGWDDIVVVGFPGEESWWFRNPQGKEGMWERFVIDDFVGNESIPYEDIDGDGLKELIYLNNRGQYGYAKPDPSDPTKKWVFRAISPISNLGKFTHGQGIGDVNGDGRLDILESSGWWEQPPAGTDGFWTKHDFRFSNVGGAHMFAYDVDGDGDNDVITSLAAHQYGLAWYEQVPADGGGITFRQHIILKEKPEPNEYGVSFSQLHAVDLVDIDGDGVRDVVTGKRHWAHNGHDPDERGRAVLYWFRIVRGPDGVTFVPYLIDDDSGVGTQVSATDVTGDGLPDIIVGNKLGTFVHIQKVRKVSKEEWESAQPKRMDTEKASAAANPKNRLSGIVPTGTDGRKLNLDFEKGNLDDWRVAKGNAFLKQPVSGDSVARRRRDMQSGHAGTFWVGTFEGLGDGPQGVLESEVFPVTAPFASFLVGGGSERTSRVEIVEHPSGSVLFRTSAANHEQMRPVLVDLSRHDGKQIFIRLVDESSGGWGHINFDDFRFHSDKPMLVNALVPVQSNEFSHAGLSGEEAARAMSVPKGFRVDLLAAEPDVRQPVAMTIDARGRIWIAEAHTYPIRVQDGEGKDRVLIFEDGDGNGTFETRKVFVEGLNLVSGIEVGFGGLYVGAAPYLLHFKDSDADDRADGEPEILLDGWGWQDTHETLNSFNWGPDGWLYGCHGVFTHSNVGRPGAPDSEREKINAGIWRYHPTKRTFEVFAHGTSNPWGVDFNDHGQCFLTCCVIPHLFHVIEGARYHRQAGVHFNPYTFADIGTIAKHRHWIGAQPHAGNSFSAEAGGGHAHSGAMIYLGASWPREYRNQLFMHNIHGARVNQDSLAVRGSGYVGDRAPDFLIANDQWSQMLALRGGPDGQVYVNDWYDANQCHRVDPSVHDRSNGRIYRIAHESYKPVRANLSELSDEELVELQLHADDWYVRTGRRLLAERASKKRLSEEAVARLRAISTGQEDETRRLRGLWALHATTGLSEKELLHAMRDAGPYMRGFAIQFAVESREPSEAVLSELVRLAKDDPSPVVRLYLASAMTRIAPDRRWDVLGSLVAHSEDRDDHNLPLMYWYAAEPLGGINADRAIALAEQAKTPRFLEFMARRVVLSGEAAGLACVVGRLGTVSDAPRRMDLLRGLVTGLEGKRRVEMPDGWAETSAKLLAVGDKDVDAQVRALSVKFGDARMLAGLRAIALDQSADIGKRRESVEALLSVKDSRLAETLHGLLAVPELRGIAIRGLAGYRDAETPKRLLAVYAELPLNEQKDALSTLTSRASYAHALLDAVASGDVKSSDLGGDVVQQMRLLKDATLDKRVNELWGIVRESAEEKQAIIRKYQAMLTSKSKQKPDPHLGRAVYARTCGTCHELFGSGSDVGPGLTGSNRRDLGYLLHNVLDPSAVMAKEYQPYVILTADGRVVTGLLKVSNDDSVTIRTATESVVVPRDEIEEMRISEKSMMPEDQWEKLSEHEVRSLVAYLSSASQTPMLATAETASLLFNGRDLTGWTGDPKLWSVEDGELVGRSSGLAKNAFLVSDLLVRDFRLRLQVKLTPNAGNSGIQFRSEVLEGGEVKGCQADIGASWWGKLYEEHGRGLLWDRSGESHVRVGEWNDYEIMAKGSRIRTFLNGSLCVDLNDEEIARSGVLALQLHSGPAMEVRFRRFFLEVEGNPVVQASGSVEENDRNVQKETISR